MIQRYTTEPRKGRADNQRFVVSWMKSCGCVQYLIVQLACRTVGSEGSKLSVVTGGLVVSCASCSSYILTLMVLHVTFDAQNDDRREVLHGSTFHCLTRKGQKSHCRLHPCQKVRGGYLHIEPHTRIGLDATVHYLTACISHAHALTHIRTHMHTRSRAFSLLLHIARAHKRFPEGVHLYICCQLRCLLICYCC